MLFYLFSADELGELFARLGYPFERETIPRNVAYYAARSSHGSTLSRVVHSWVLARSDRLARDAAFRRSVAERCERYPAGHYCRRRPPRRDGGNGRSGAARGNQVSLRWAMYCWLNPKLPQEIDRLGMRIRYRGHSLDLRVTRDALTVPRDRPRPCADPSRHKESSI